MYSQKDWLLIFGAGVFLLGLMTGFVGPLLLNPRMGLSAHLEGLMNGTFLIAIGAIWDRVHLGPALKKTAFGLFLFGTTANWATVFLGAAWGASMLMPISGNGHTGTPLQENIVATLLMVLSIAMLIATALMLAGLLRKRA
ncbi:hydrogenase [Hyphomonas sp.]|uniref:hydrogenase n=1 Tax=Hyphomonas sp. TaxID=87 RepID=UPI003528FAF4